MMFDKADRERQAKLLSEAKERSNTLDMLAEVILESGAPEEMKVGLRALRAQRQLNDEIQDMIAPHVGEGNDPEVMRQIYEYLEMVRAGVQTFKKTLENKGEIK